jgi:hypothetical protein
VPAERKKQDVSGGSVLSKPPHGVEDVLTRRVTRVAAPAVVRQRVDAILGPPVYRVGTPATPGGCKIGYVEYTC